MKQMLARVVFTVSLAAIIGPMCIWIALSKPGDVYMDPSLNTSEQQQLELEQSMGIALLCLGGVGVLAFLGHWLCFKPYKPETTSVNADKSINEISNIIAADPKTNFLDSF